MHFANNKKFNQHNVALLVQPKLDIVKISITRNKENYQEMQTTYRTYRGEKKKKKMWLLSVITNNFLHYTAQTTFWILPPIPSPPEGKEQCTGLKTNYTFWGVVLFQNMLLLNVYIINTHRFRIRKAAVILTQG